MTDSPTSRADLKDRGSARYYCDWSPSPLNYRDRLTAQRKKGLLTPKGLLTLNFPGIIK